ncbi:hypothetical protein EYZ11_012575 [Aspergillus tanneri]|uniref:Uncharacterized protein n=1 Tax=Aspergillus tanneri TaxID=1220188 RepID=A0A4S3J063_9EURO|nr:hypothetical protein EYZ11_012575 [Aspergillus tanneri]
MPKETAVIPNQGKTTMVLILSKRIVRIDCDFMYIASGSIPVPGSLVVAQSHRNRFIYKRIEIET